MKTAGIVAEYNPFHKGHEYQISLLRERGYEGIVAVMSGNFVQRADAALTDKYRRAEGAVAAGVDLVLELPLPYAVAAAEDFARGGIRILQATGIVNAVCCGCESGDEENLRQYEALREAEKSGKIKENMKTGLSYPAACKKAVADAGAPWSDKPNDVLALAYRKALEVLDAGMELLAIERKGNYHEDDGTGFESAESIRERMRRGEDVTKALPTGSYERIKDAPLADLKRLERATMAFYRTADPEKLREFYGMREGLPERLCKYADAETLEVLADRAKTKRFPHSAVRRAILCGYLQIPRKLPEITYLRVLAFNERGQELLREMKKTSTLPVLPILTPERWGDPMAAIQLRGDEIFALTTDPPAKRFPDLTESARKVPKI